MLYAVESVPGANMAAMVGVLCFCFLFPIILCVFWKLRTKANLSSFFIGCGTFIVFALILEQILHSVVFMLTGTLLTDNMWFYALYGGLAAGLFEETGRLLAMRFLMKKNLNRQNAILYGIGHGGVEAMLVTGLAYVSNLILAVTINAGGLNTILAQVDENTANTLYAQLSQLWTLSAGDFLLAGVERLSAVTLHIVLSYMVYRAVKGSKIAWYLAAVGIHFAMDAGTILLLRVCGLSTLAVEGILLAAVAVMLVCMIRAYRREGA